jgi:hypothetical protein
MQEIQECYCLKIWEILTSWVSRDELNDVLWTEIMFINIAKNVIEISIKPQSQMWEMMQILMN